MPGCCCLARTIEDVLYREELEELASGGVAVHTTLTRGAAPDGWQGWTRRIDREMLLAVGPAPAAGPLIYVCGPTPFVEEAARLLVALGHEPADRPHRALRTHRRLRWKTCIRTATRSPGCFRRCSWPR